MHTNPDLTKTEDEKNILHKAHKTINEIEDKFIKFGPKKWCFLYDINDRKIEKIELYTSLMRHDGDLIEVLRELKIKNYIDLCKTIESN